MNLSFLNDKKLIALFELNKKKWYRQEKKNELDRTIYIEGIWKHLETLLELC